MPENNTTSTEVKKITVGIVISWILGIIFLIAGIGFIFQSFLTGILSLLVAFLLLPPANSFLSKKLKFTLSGGLKFVLIIILLALMGLTAPKNEGAEIKDNDNEKETVEEGSKGKPYLKEQVVTVGEIDWKIISVENLGTEISSGNKYIENCKAKSGTFLKLVVSLKNNRKELFSLTDLTLVDNQDRRFVTSSDVYTCVEDTLFILENINPGIEDSFTAIYEIPSDATGLMLEIDSTGSLFSGETNKYISLGL